MSVSMIGIDHTAASVDVRARFSFTRKEAGEAMEKIHAMEGIDGCILLSTCNRMELWVSAEEEMPDLYEILCSLKAVDRLEYNGIFVQRTDREAVKHLFILPPD